MTTFLFPDCRLDVHPSGETTAYFCPTGRILERLPRPVEDRVTARFLGYGADYARFRREHDLLLHTLAALQGFGCSPHLRSLAHYDGLKRAETEAGEDEEDLAARVHRWLNLDTWSDEIEPLLACGLQKEELRAFLRAVLEGEITYIEAPLLVSLH